MTIMENSSKSPLTDDQQAWLDATPIGYARSIERCGVTFTVDRRAPGSFSGFPLTRTAPIQCMWFG